MKHQRLEESNETIQIPMYKTVVDETVLEDTETRTQYELSCTASHCLFRGEESWYKVPDPSIQEGIAKKVQSNGKTKTWQDKSI